MSNTIRKKQNNIFVYIILTAVLLMMFLLSICLGSVMMKPLDIFKVIFNGIIGREQGDLSTVAAIILPVRIPRVLCVALTGASLSICGAAMQGLLKNPLADGSTLGVSQGASLGAVVSLAFGITFPGSVFSGRMIMAIIFAAVSLFIIITISFKIDASLSGNTLILVGVIFSMLAGSLYSLVISFAGEKAGAITFWMLGSLRGSNYTNAAVLAVALLICSVAIIMNARELNACAISEENAISIGVNVKRVRIIILVAVSVLIGVCVSIGGTIGFVGLITPHLIRKITGPNHKILLPVSLFAGATLLMAADIIARTILSPRELPIGVVTSIVGSIVFIVIFMKNRRT